MVTSDTLTEIARSMHVVRLGSPLINAGQSVTVKLMPPPWELGALDLTALPTPIAAPVNVVDVIWNVYGDDGTTLLSPDQFIALDSRSASEASFLFAPRIAELTNDVPLPPPARRFIGASVKLAAGVPNTSNYVQMADYVAVGPVPVVVPAVAVPTVLALFRHPHFQAWDLDRGPGAALVVVPSNSPLRRLEDLQHLIGVLDETMSPLAELAQFGLYAVGLQTLAAALAAQPRLAFVSNDEIPNLNAVKLMRVTKQYVVDGIQTSAWPPAGLELPGRHSRLRIPAINVSGPGFAIPGSDAGDDIEAEDEMSALIMIGPPPQESLWAGQPTRHRAVECYNQRDYQENKGRIDVKVGPEMFVMIGDLGAIHNEADAGMASIPNGNINVVAHWQQGFSEILSSLKIVWRDRIVFPPPERPGLPRRERPGIERPGRPEPQ